MSGTLLPSGPRRSEREEKLARNVIPSTGPPPGESLHRRGFALVTVLVIMTVLTAAAVAASRVNRTELNEAANLADSIKLYYMAKSGLNGAEALLGLDRNNYDAVTEQWAKADEFAAKASLLFGTGALEVVIRDEAGKIPLQRFFEGGKVNEPIRDILLRLLRRKEFALAPGQAEQIVAALRDWLDPDDDAGGDGAESAYYRTLAEPYEAKNGPLDCIYELLMIRGITSRLFHGAPGSPGLKKFLTIRGEGRINVNTAPREVLLSLREGVTEEMVDKLDSFRRDERNDLSQPNWHRAIVGADFDPHQLLTVRSASFVIVATAHRNRMKRTIEAAYTREKDRLHLRSWKVN